MTRTTEPETRDTVPGSFGSSTTPAATLGILIRSSATPMSLSMRVGRATTTTTRSSRMCGSATCLPSSYSVRTSCLGKTAVSLSLTEPWQLRRRSPSRVMRFPPQEPSPLTVPRSSRKAGPTCSHGLTVAAIACTTGIRAMAQQLGNSRIPGRHRNRYLCSCSPTPAVSRLPKSPSPTGPSGFPQPRPRLPTSSTRRLRCLLQKPRTGEREVTSPIRASTPVTPLVGMPGETSRSSTTTVATSTSSSARHSRRSPKSSICLLVTTPCGRGSR